MGKQGLWPGRRWAGKDGTREAIRACEHLQLDPLVIVARSHDLMLHSRVAGYHPEFFDELVYTERAFFDWGGWLAVRPMEELPYWRVVMRRNREHPGLRLIAEQHGTAIEEVRLALRERGTVSSRDFQATGRRAVTSYRGARDTSLALYYLWRVGEAMTHHREGFERVYAATESVASPHLIAEASDSEAERILGRKAVAFAGIGRSGPLSGWFGRRVSKAEERAIEQELLDSGDIVSVDVEGARGAQFALASDVPLLAEVDCGRIPAAWAPVGTSTEAEVVLLSPLDPVSARGRAKALFDFEYVWEIYKRPELLQFGRYTMPILWGDRLVGRIDAKMDRKSNTLVVNGVWLEGAFGSPQPAFLDALGLGLQRAMAFLGTERVDAAAVEHRGVRSRIAALNKRRLRVRRQPASSA
ncbi:MAG: DNA glycosylase AlkZ-like family protein [Dehalococcoidia bacterium]